MTRRELNLAIFEGTADRPLWQPRLETWIHHLRNDRTLPDRYKGMDDLQIYDALSCSVRYAASAGIDRFSDDADVERSERQQGDWFIVTTRTPSGTIETGYRDIWEGPKLKNRRIHGFPVKTVEQMRVATDLVERERFSANLARFQEAADRVGHRGEPTIFLSSSGFTELIKNWCGLPDTYYLLADHPAEIERHLEACDRRDDRLIDAALQLPCRIFNLGDHATNEFTPPPILKRFLMPRWQRISARLHKHNRFVHTHWDGDSRTMLPYLKDTGLDGVEALPPAPMGDMTLEEIKAAVGDRIVCLDLLPAIHFLDHYSMQTCLDFTKRVMDMFSPRLILGISDEISQVGQIEKVEAITELVRSTCGLPD